MMEPHRTKYIHVKCHETVVNNLYNLVCCYRKKLINFVESTEKINLRNNNSEKMAFSEMYLYVCSTPEYKVQFLRSHYMDASNTDTLRAMRGNLSSKATK